MLLSLGLVLLLATATPAAISIVAEPRTELLYSTGDVDCTELHAKASAELPFHAVRLRALMDGAEIDPNAVQLKWSFRGEPVGTLAADRDLGPTGSLPSVTSMCADFGNACVLSGAQLSVYNDPTILYVAPKCDGLSRDPSRPFTGGSARIRVKATSGGRKLGRADATIGFGRVGSATVLVQNTAGNFVNGQGRDTGVLTFVITQYAANVEEPPGMAAQPEFYQVSGDLGSVSLNDGPCEGGEACGVIEQTGGRGTMLLTATYPDESALCDNIRVVVDVCSPDVRGELRVTPQPLRTTYDPANPSQGLVDIRVSLHNNSRPQGDLPACNFVLAGPRAVTCQSKVKAGQFTETKNTVFDLPHCSESLDPCSTNAECPAGELCLTQPYCSTTKSRTCATDEDCAPPACPECTGQQICVHILHPTDVATQPLYDINPGKSLVLVTGQAVLRNHFRTAAALTDTWTVNVRIPAVSFSKKLKYKIRSRP